MTIKLPFFMWLLLATQAWAQNGLVHPETLVLPTAPARAQRPSSARQMAPAEAVIRYVKAGGTGAGTSWATASGDLQAMINASASGDQVWIAGGTYKPNTTGLANVRTAAFSLRGGVSVVGGFTGTSGTEGINNNSTRTSTPSSTTLSGDIGTVGDNSDNCYHVINNIDQNRPGNALALTGVVITAGNANGTTNTQDGAGGGFISADNTASLINCIFIQNSASVLGGGMYIQSADGLSLTNCLFANNSAAFGGGFTSGAGTTATLTNCFFEKNAGSQNGGGTDQAGDATGTTTYINCTFRGNTARGGAAIDVAGSTTTRLINCLLWDNRGQNTINSFGTATVTASYCLIQTGAATYTDGGNNRTLTSSPFNNASGPALSACAPAVDAGNDAANTTTTDVLGNARKVRTIDIGAAEFQGTPSQPVALINPEQPATPICAGTTENFAVTFTGTGPFAVELFQNNVRIGTFGPFSSPSRFAAAAPISQGGSYQYVVTTACNSVTTTFAPIIVNPLPTQYALTGGGAYCQGSSGVVVGLSGSETGVNYQLRRDGNPVGSPTAGTGGPLNFGTQTTAGTYTVLATNASTSCQQTMSGSASVTVNPLPTVYTVSGGGAFCAGGTGVSVTLSGSQIGINYQLLRDNTPVGSPLAGTGNAISFGSQATAGSYGVRATVASTGCQQSMTGPVSVSVNPTPVISITTPPAVCAPATVDLTRFVTTDIATTLRFFTNAARTQPVATPTAVSTSGTYYVEATSGQSCVSSSSVTAVINTPPTVSIVPSALTGCAGTLITLSAQGADSYVWSTGATTTAIPVTATGTGVYSVTGTVTSTGCSATASQSITIYPTPPTPTLLTKQGQSYPGGQSSVTVDLNSPSVVLEVGNCNGTISWNGSNGSAGNTNIIVPTDRAGRVVYTARCISAQGCVSDPASATVTVQGRLTVLHRDVDNYADNNAIQPLLVLQNQGGTALPLSRLTLRYYLTVEGNSALSNLSVNYAQVGNGNVRLRYVPLNPAQQGASGYVEVSFTAGAGSLAAGANSGPIQAYFAKSDYGSLFEPDDYSYNPVRDQLTATQRITVYYDGVLIAGIEPGSTASVRALRALTESRNGPSATQINTVLEVRNEGTVPVNYSDLRARYYFTSDGNERLQVDLDEGNVNARLVALPQPVAGANYYLEIRYNQSGQLAPGASTGAIRYRISKPDGGRFDQTNDYSYQEQPAERSQNRRVVVLINNEVVWGTLPSGASARVGVSVEPGSVLSVRVLGNPIEGDQLQVEVTGAQGQPLRLLVSDLTGRVVSQKQIEAAGAVEQQSLSMTQSAAGLFLLQVSTPSQTQTVKVLKGQ